MKILSTQPNFNTSKVQQNPQKANQPTSNLQQDTVSFGIRGPIIKQKNYIQVLSNSVVDKLVAKTKYQHYVIGDNVVVKSKVNAHIVDAGKKFTAKSVTASDVSIGDNLDVKKIKSFGDVSLGKINSLKSITLLKHPASPASQADRVLTLPCASDVKPGKISVYLDNLNSLTIVTPEGIRSILKKIELIDLKTKSVIDPLKNTFISVKSAFRHAKDNFMKTCEERGQVMKFDEHGFEIKN